MRKQFYQRYILLCEQHGMDPCSRKAASLLGTNRATISHWRTNCSMPKGEMISRVADVFHVSSDYLLGRTDDPSDYAAKTKLLKTERSEETARLHLLLQRLDHEDLLKLEGVVQGMLFADKYQDIVNRETGSEGND